MDKIATLLDSDLLAKVQMNTQEANLKRAKTLSKQSVKSDKEVDKAAGGFEALLLHQMLKAMWATVNTDGLMGEDSHEGQIYRDMLNQAIADSVAEGKGIGVKEFLKKELLKTTK